jgi:hypothetical protein
MEDSTIREQGPDRIRRLSTGRVGVRVGEYWATSLVGDATANPTASTINFC